MILLTLDVTISDSCVYYKNEVAIVSVGQKSIGYLYRALDEDNWYVYGYIVNPDGRGRTGDLRDIIGEHPNRLEMAKRLLAYKGFIPSNSQIYVRDSGIIDDTTYEKVVLGHAETPS